MSGNDQKKRAELLKILYHEQGGICTYCQRKMHLDLQHNGLQASFEHKIPRARGGLTTLENGVASCRRCNNAKSIMLDPEFRDAIRAFGSVDEFIKACSRARNIITGIKKERRQRVLRMMRPELFEPGGFLYERERARA